MRSIWQFIKAMFLMLFGLVIVCVALAIYLVWAWPAFVLIVIGSFLLLKVAWKLAGSRKLVVGEDEAVVVEQWGNPVGSLYYGRHELPLGALARKRYALQLGVYAGNEAEAVTTDEERVRVRSRFKAHISDPQLYHYGGRRRWRGIQQINQQALQTVLSEFSADDLWNCSPQINRQLVRLLNRELQNWGVHITHYCIEAAIWPETNERWQRNKSRNALKGAESYWLGQADAELSLS